MFGVQFVLFVVSTAEKYFSQILAGFADSETTGARKVENRAQMIQLCTQKIPTLFGV